MIATELISQLISPLRGEDSGEEALTMMNIFHVRHLPIVKDDNLLGMISEDDILNHALDDPIGSYRLSLTNPFVHQSDHFFDVMKKIAEGGLTVIPVINAEEKYIGIITLEDLVKFYATSFSFNEYGGIIVLEMHKQDYILSEIAKIVEDENAVIISSFISSLSDNGSILVSIKVNTNELGSITASLERFEYEIYASYTELEEIDSLKDRYDSLMKYLSI